MPAWWGKKSGGSKSSESKTKSSSVKYEKKREKEIVNKVNSYEENLQSRNSPRSSREFSAAARELSGVDASGFSGFDSASSLDKAHPLPRPTDQSSDRGQGVGIGPGSGSVSSVSSSGSCDDHAHGAVDHPAFRLV